MGWKVKIGVLQRFKAVVSSATVWFPEKAGYMMMMIMTTMMMMMIMMMIIIIIIIYLFTVIGLSPGGSVYFTCKQNMKLVITKFKSGGLHEKHVLATWNLGNHLSVCL